MNYSIINDLMTASINSVASFTEKEKNSSMVIEAINFSLHDVWLYAVSFVGLLILALIILFVMKRNRNKVDEDE